MAVKFKNTLSMKNSKKGFSLLELICAIIILALVISSTVAGLSISYRSILVGAEKDKASALAQKYCDIIMTYVSETPSNEPGMGGDSTKNKLFKASSTHELEGDIIDAIEVDTAGADAITQAKPTDIYDTRTRTADKVYFTIEKEGTKELNESPGSTTKIYYCTYKITVYIDYTNENTTYCTGSITKPAVVA
ncbi:MAG TPA: type II secretion system protein [Clostridiales bacterium]|nr:type II secretion system protein [Clostridiales bacterium]